MSDRSEPRRVAAQGRFLRMLSHDGWEWVERTSASGAW